MVSNCCCDGRQHYKTINIMTRTCVQTRNKFRRRRQSIPPFVLSQFWNMSILRNLPNAPSEKVHFFAVSKLVWNLSLISWRFLYINWWATIWSLLSLLIYLFLSVYTYFQKTQFFIYRRLICDGNNWNEVVKWRCGCYEKVLLKRHDERAHSSWSLLFMEYTKWANNIFEQTSVVCWWHCWRVLPSRVC